MAGGYTSLICLLWKNTHSFANISYGICNLPYTFGVCLTVVEIL